MDKYGDLARFVCVYIMEAHAKDQWPLGKLSTFDQHKTMDDRIRAAKHFQSEFNYRPEIYVDTMSNEFNNLYCTWPERGFVISTKEIPQIGNSTILTEQKIIEYISDPQLDGSIDWEEGVSKWLANYFGY